MARESVNHILTDIQSAGDRRWLITGSTTQVVADTGWMPVTETWTRTGDHTFILSGDLTTRYRKGTRVQYNDGAVDYGVVGSSAYTSGTTTTVNLIPNTDYAMAAATITGKNISYILTPEGFPDWFNYSMSWTAVSINPSIGNGSLYGRWKARGKSVFVKTRVILSSTTTVGSGLYSFSTPISATDLTNGVAVESAAGNMLDQSGGTRYALSAFVRTNDMRGIYANGIMSDTVPLIPASGDVINLSAEYEF